jgi:hypothetical protein
VDVLILTGAADYGAVQVSGHKVQALLDLVNEGLEVLNRILQPKRHLEGFK